MCSVRMFVLFALTRPRAVDEGNEFTGKSVARTSSARGLEAASAIIEEDEEEEEEG